MSVESSHAVFLSYAREDTAAARRIADALRGFGVEVWFDQSELRGGDAWDQKIRGQIKECALFVPVISAHTESRGEGYFRLEWKLADERTHLMAKGVPFLVPVVVDDTADGDAMVPDSFRAVQWMRLAGGTPTPEFVAQIKRLLEAPRRTASVGRGLPTSPLSRGDTSPAGSGDPALQPRGRRFSVGAIALVAVVLGLVAYIALRPAAKETPAATPKPVVETKSAAPAINEKSIAVLPFVNMGADKNDEYLGDGMTEELLNALAKIKGLRVPGRSSSFAFKGRTDDDIFRKVGEKLHVSTVLEGSVRKVGDKLRITVQLINCADGNHLWSEEYDRSMNDLLAIQTEVAQQVAQKLQVTLGVEESRALAKKPTENAEAYRLYLLGRHQWGRNTEAGSTSAMKYFEEALRLDPAFALAYCGLSDCYGWIFGAMPGLAAWEKEKEMAQKALALDPGLADAHLSLGLALSGFYDWRGAEREIRRAIELNPNLPLAHDQLGWVCRVMGRFDEAIAESRKALELDPLALVMHHTSARTLMFAHRYDEAIAFARKMVELDPNYAGAHDTLGWSLLWKGERANARAEFEKAIALDDTPHARGALGYCLAVSGERAKAEQVLRDLDEIAKRRYVSPEAQVFIYLGLGENDQALDWLEKCYAQRDSALWTLKIDPIFDRVRSEPRFQALLKKAGYDP